MIGFLKKHFTHPFTAKLLLTLLLVDSIFIVIHIVIGILYTTGSISDYNLYADWLLTRDRSYPEFFQYLKYLWIIYELAKTISKHKVKRFIAWILLFLFFFLDDAFTLHEQWGYRLSRKFNFEPALGLRAEDFGELLFTTVIGSFILLGFILTIKNSNRKFKKNSLDLFLLVGILLFFGIVLDMVHIMLGEHIYAKFILRITGRWW